MWRMKSSIVITLFLGICLHAPYAHAWGTYVCDLQEQGLQKIEEACSESASKFHSPLSSLESKLEKVLTFVEEIKTAEDSWFHITKRSGMVERDLSQHEETRRTDRHEDKIINDRRSNEEDRNMDERMQENNSKQAENGNSEEERTKTEDHENDDDTDNRRDRTDDRDNRRDRTDEYERHDRRDRVQDRARSDRTRGYDRENQRDSSADDDDKERNQEDRNDDRRGKEDKEENKTGPKKGECVSQVLDSHETIGMFYMMSYQHGHCANRNPIREPIKYCLGYCTTKTFIDRDSGMWSQGNDCKSCQATAFETLRIPLSCDDGFTFEKKFKNVVDCSCRRCTAPDNTHNN